ncbi:hypothetical protein BpHYR1_050118 [Brachionus plicatilis]|uniref:Uncharacterized protein n=1 Tax=Brachionus plicatilis TaxID=10195 RepID=A0A3M7RCU4_BRAPC|nr:hypothetical protein BpHYR1_050118 [Brachionus plicatilis]
MKSGHFDRSSPLSFLAKICHTNFVIKSRITNSNYSMLIIYCLHFKNPEYSLFWNFYIHYLFKGSFLLCVTILPGISSSQEIFADNNYEAGNNTENFTDISTDFADNFTDIFTDFPDNFTEITVINITDNSPSSTKPDQTKETDYTPFIISGSIVLAVLILAVVSFFAYRYVQKKKYQKYFKRNKKKTIKKIIIIAPLGKFSSKNEKKKTLFYFGINAFNLQKKCTKSRQSLRYPDEQRFDDGTFPPNKFSFSSKLSSNTKGPRSSEHHNWLSLVRSRSMLVIELELVDNSEFKLFNAVVMWCCR